MSKKVKLLEQFLEEGLFDVVTKSKAFIKNPISATKITNNGKKLAQAEVDSAATDLDFEKRKLAASQAAKQKIEALKKKGDDKGAQKVKDELSDNRDVLAKAHDQKSDALTDKVSGIKDRIDDLSKKNSSLQDLASLVKTAARVKKNEVLFKGADDEEKKQLKLQMKDDMEKIQGIQKGFGDYKEADEPEDKSSKPKDKKDVTIDTGDDKGAPSAPSQPAAKDTNTPAPSTTSQKPEGTAQTKPEGAAQTKPEGSKDISTARQELADGQRVMANNKRAVSDLEDKIKNIESGKYDNKKIKDPKAEISRLQDELKKAKDAFGSSEEDVKMLSAELDKVEKASQDKGPDAKSEPPAKKDSKPEVKVPPPPAPKSDKPEAKGKPEVKVPPPPAPKSDKPEVKVPPPPDKKKKPKETAESLTKLKSFEDFVNEKKFL
jgi:hypothetical protein